ncbi:MAG TPA: hypothetical protein VGZ48_01025 [Candidatus Acidoferrales bacterium]|nr:hypothetical protein [Candidatus Acidoferrales bacterium]
MDNAKTGHDESDPHIQGQDLLKVRLIPEDGVSGKEQWDIEEISLHAKKAVKNAGGIGIKNLGCPKPEEDSQPKKKGRLERRKFTPPVGGEHREIGEGDDDVFSEEYVNAVAGKLADQILEDQPGEKNKNPHAPVLQNHIHQDKADGGNEGCEKIKICALDYPSGYVPD